MFLFVDNMIVYIENPKKTEKKFPVDIIGEFSKVAIYIIIIRIQMYQFGKKIII